MLQDGSFTRATSIHHYILFLQFGKGESTKLRLNNVGCIPMYILESVASGHSENNV